MGNFCGKGLPPPPAEIEVPKIVPPDGVKNILEDYNFIDDIQPAEIAFKPQVNNDFLADDSGWKDYMNANYVKGRHHTELDQ